MCRMSLSRSPRGSGTLDSAGRRVRLLDSTAMLLIWLAATTAVACGPTTAQGTSPGGSESRSGEGSTGGPDVTSSSPDCEQMMPLAKLATAAGSPLRADVTGTTHALGTWFCSYKFVPASSDPRLPQLDFRWEKSSIDSYLAEPERAGKIKPTVEPTLGQRAYSEVDNSSSLIGSVGITCPDASNSGRWRVNLLVNGGFPDARDRALAVGRLFCGKPSPTPS